MGLVTGALIGILTGISITALLWDEENTWRGFIKYQIAAQSLAAAMLIAGGHFL